MNIEPNRLKEVFAKTLEFKSADERENYLAAVCKNDPELTREVKSLLLAHGQSGEFFNQTVELTAADLDSARLGMMIGRYKLLEKIGEGGFGVVFMAEQKEPVERKVALKIIKAGMDTKEVIARFEAERQALALMDHPNIAKVLDGGATEAGRPYFVMELVRGVPITDYCDQNSLPTAQRLQLFIKVCQAVQHAHQKAVIHRDLKPSNILVTLHDGEPVPKVIDFGVAKALGQKLTEKTLFTAFRQMIGTPAYMSPEQAEMSGLDIDTRSDIYSLGVLLYELLTGVTPFDKETFAKAALDEIRRLIKEVEPPKPSTRLRTLGEKLTEVAKHRQTEPAALSKHITGDLDWIVMKCLEKDRSRRYETASALGRDLERHLKNEPVSAAAPTITYRLSKFVKRHQTTMLRSAAAFLIGSLVVSAFFWLMAGRGPRWFPDIRPGARAVNTPPHLDFERGISDVYVPDYSVIAPGVRMIGSERHLFIRLKAGPGGWRAFDLVRRQVVNLHAQSVAYVTSQDAKHVFELAIDAQGLVSRQYPDGLPVPITPTPAASDDLAMLVAVPRLVRGLVVCAVPQKGILFAFDPQSGHMAWTNLAAAHIDAPDTRIGNVTADDEVVVAGMWGSRIWTLDAATGRHRWARETCSYGNAIQAVVAGSRVFGFAANQNAYAFERATGRQVWQRLVGRSDSEDSVVVHGANLILWQPPGAWAGGCRVMAIRQEDGREQWQIPLLTNHWGGSIGGSGDFVVGVSGRILQRIDPRTGMAGSFLELPTLKRTVTLFGQETSVFVSHPVVLASPDSVYAFTVDGSLWCAHLPQTSTNVVVPSLEVTRQSREPIPEQLATTDRPTPPLPAEIGARRAELERNGQASLWTEWEAKINEAWAEAQGYARQFGGFPHVVVGRVVVPKSEDPRQVLAQMKILQEGYFATAIKDLQQPLCFRLPGCLPVDLQLKGRAGELIFVSDVVLPGIAPGQAGSIRGRIRIPDGSDAKGVRVSASISMGPINHMSNGSEPRQYFPEPIGGNVSADGQFLIPALSPTEHVVNITAQGFLPVIKNITVTSGGTTDLGEVVLERPLSVQLSWMVEEKPEFSNAQRRTVTVLAGKTWKSKPSSDRFDLRFKQLNGRLFFDYFYGPCRITDLGAHSLDGTLGFDVGFLTFQPPQGELEAGHVYLFQQEAFSSPYWVLLHIDKIMTDLADSAKVTDAEGLNKQQEDAVLALKEVLRVQDEGFNSKLLFIPRSNLLAVAFNDRTIRLVWLPKGNSEGILTGLDATADCLAVSADGKELFAGTGKGSVFMWTDGRDPPVRVCSSGEWPVTALAASPNGERIVWVSNGKYGLDQKWATPDESAVGVEVASGKKLWGTKVGRGDFQAAAFEGEGRTVALVQPTKVVLLDSAAGRVIRELQQDQYPSSPLSVAMSRDGRVCAVGYAPSRVGLWDTTQGKFLRLLPAHQNWVVSLAFTGDGALVATSAGDSSASIWKVATGTEIGRIRFGDGETYVLSVSFSEDGRWLAAGRRGEYVVLEVPGVPLPSRASSER